MGQYTDASNVFQYSLTGNAVIDSLLYAQSQFRYAWATQSNGVYQVTYSLPFTTNPTALFQNNYGPEPGAADVHGANQTEQSAIALAFASWAAVANIQFTEVAETGGGEVGDIRIAFSSAVGGNNWGYTKIVSSGAQNQHGDIWISPDIGADPWGPGSFNFTAMMHEIGHALGLDHPFSGNIAPGNFDNGRYTIMSYTDPANVWFFNQNTLEFEYLLYTPMVYDIAAIQAIYGANMNTNSGNTFYSYAKDEPFFATIWDGGGVDTIDLSDFTNGCVVKLTPGSYSTLKFSNHNVSQNLGIAFGCFIENAIGGYGNDLLQGNIQKNTLLGLEGDDRLIGLGGDDYLQGGAGDDRLVGGAGKDTADYTDALAALLIDLNSRSAATLGGGNAAGTGTDTLIGIENIRGSQSDDEIYGNGGINELNGMGGHDFISGRNGSDILIGNGGSDQLIGGAGNDTILGGTGYDKMSGGAGQDILRGGAGRDNAIGGVAADIFVFADGEISGTDAASSDRIIDFSHGQNDKIDLSLVDAIAGGGDNAFTFIGTAAFSNTAGQLRYQQISGNTYIQGDTDGAGGADFWIRVDGLKTLVESDFIL